MEINQYPPGPKNNSILGELPRLLKDPIATVTQLFETYGDFVYFKKGLHYRYLLTNPVGVQRVLVENQNNYRKSPRYQKLTLALGKGLLTTDGKEWVQQRKMSQSLFRPQALEAFANLIQNEIEKKIPQWKNKKINLFLEMTSLTLNIATRCFFGFDSNSYNSADISKNIDLALTDLNFMMESVPLPDWLPNPRKRRLLKTVKELDKIVFAIINERKNKSQLQADGQFKADLLTRMFEEHLSPLEMRDQVMTFLVTGHETTATHLTWTIYLLLCNPEYLQASVLSEIGITNVINECLRLRPPVWIFSREAIEADELLGFPIAKGTTLNLSPYLTHRHPKYWQDPEKFEPSRFQNSQNLHKGAFYPFALGSRQCIGSQFAMLVTKMTLTRILDEFRIELVSPTDQSVGLNAGVVLRPQQEIHIQMNSKQP